MQTVGFLMTRLILVLSDYFLVKPMILTLVLWFLTYFACLYYVLKFDYRKSPKFWDARKLYCNLPKIQEKRSNLGVFRQKDANGMANSGDPDQTAPLVAV